jgi:hypothetical protein
MAAGINDAGLIASPSAEGACEELPSSTKQISAERKAQHDLEQLDMNSSLGMGYSPSKNVSFGRGFDGWPKKRPILNWLLNAPTRDFASKESGRLF